MEHGLISRSGGRPKQTFGESLLQTSI